MNFIEKAPSYAPDWLVQEVQKRWPRLSALADLASSLGINFYLVGGTLRMNEAFADFFGLAMELF